MCKNRCGLIESALSLISTTGGRPDFRKFSHKPFYTEAHHFSNITPNFPIFVSIDIFSYPLFDGVVEIIKYAPQENLGFKEATILSVSVLQIVNILLLVPLNRTGAGRPSYFRQNLMLDFY